MVGYYENTALPNPRRKRCLYNCIQCHRSEKKISPDRNGKSKIEQGSDGIQIERVEIELRVKKQDYRNKIIETRL